jgi:signal transduction histidine kinase
MLREFIEVHRDEIIRRCREKVANRSVPPPTEAEIDHGVPLFLNQLMDALVVGWNPTAAISNSACLHGHDLLVQGFTVSQVVHDYGDVCQSITQLAMELNAPISAEDFGTLNRCLDDAIAGAVTEFGRGRNQSTQESETARGTERLGFLAHELGNLTNTALLAFEAIRRGNVGVAGSTGAVLHRSLIGTKSLISRALGEVRLTQGVQNPERFLVSEFVDEIAAGAKLDADARGVGLVVLPVEDGIAIEADRQVLAAVIGNLLQNAFKFTRPQTAVTLRVGASAERVLIEVEDECGGLPGDDGKDLFHPFEQRNADRSGLGLGLAFSRWGVQANKGRLYTRTLPDRGCVFVVDLPRHQFVPSATPSTVER